MLSYHLLKAVPGLDAFKVHDRFYKTKKNPCQVVKKNGSS